MLKFILAFLAMIFNVSIYAQTLDWERTFFDTSFSQCRSAGIILADHSGNLYSIGHSTNVISTGNDILIVKYDSSGNQQWFTTYNGASNKNEGVFGAAINSNNELILCGEIFDTSNTNNILVMKYSDSGQLIWIDTVDGTSALYDKGFAVCIDDSNNVYAAGYTFQGSYSGIVIKYDNSGNRLWSKTLPSTQQSTKINFYDGYVYVASLTGPTGIPSHASVIKLDVNGNIIWNQMINNGNSDIIRNIIFEKSEIYMIDELGSASGSGGHFLVIDMDTSGVISWQRFYSNLFLSETTGLDLHDSLLYISVNEYTDQTYSVFQSALRGINRFNGDSIFHSVWSMAGLRDKAECQYQSAAGNVSILINSSIDSIQTNNRFNLVTFAPDGTFSGSLLLNGIPAFGNGAFDMLNSNSYLMQASIFDSVQLLPKLSTWKFSSQPVSVEETEVLSFGIYPNPTAGEFKLVNLSAGNYLWTISNLNGAILKTGSYNGIETSLNPDLSQGIYLFEQSNGKSVQRRKLVLMR